MIPLQCKAPKLGIKLPGRKHSFHSKRVAGPAAVAAPPTQSTPRTSGQDVTPKDAPLPSLYPNPPKVEANAPKLRVVIIGAGLAGLSTAVELLDQGYEVEIFDQRPHVGGKVASWQDKDGNHIEMGLHVFFGCYFNLFRLMAKCGAVENLLLKDHAHTFVNEDGDVRLLDFRFNIGDFKVGAPFHGLKAFFTTPQLSPQDKLQNALALGTSPVVRAVIDPEGGMKDVRKLDDVSFEDWFISHGGSKESINKMWDPIAYALGFLDCKDISARCMLSIFHFFATKTDASVLRMLNGSPRDRLLQPILDYIEARGGKIHMRTGCQEVLYEEGPDGKPVVTGMRLRKGAQDTMVHADCYVAALDCQGAKKLVPSEWRKYPLFDNIHKLEGVPVITVQLRYNGWVTELKDQIKVQNVSEVAGIDNLLYSSDVDFSCFADLAVTSPVDYRKEGEGSLMQVVITPCEKYMPLTNEEIAAEMHKQVQKLFPSARQLENTWHSVVKITQSLYREAPGLDKYRPDQQTPVINFYMAGSYTAQDYIDSMEGATLSGRQAAYKILENAPRISARAPTAKA
eukprot:jgi/Ulvmu1/4320/UM002_0043.1